MGSIIGCLPSSRVSCCKIIDYTFKFANFALYHRLYIFFKIQKKHDTLKISTSYSRNASINLFWTQVMNITGLYCKIKKYIYYECLSLNFNCVSIKLFCKMLFVCFFFFLYWFRNIPEYESLNINMVKYHNYN